MGPTMDEVVASMSDADACCKLLQDLPLQDFWDFINKEIEENLTADVL
jgi:hypothetical protein